MKQTKRGIPYVLQLGGNFFFLAVMSNGFVRLSNLDLTHLEMRGRIVDLTTHYILLDQSRISDS